MVNLPTVGGFCMLNVGKSTSPMSPMDADFCLTLRIDPSAERLLMIDRIKVPENMGVLVEQN